VEPVSVTEAKLHCRVDITEDDALIGSLIMAARQYAEEIAGRAFISQTWDYILDQFPGCDRIVLPRPPLISISSVKYTLYESGATSTFSASSYFADTYAEPGAVILKPGYDWPGDALYPANGVQVRYVAGYGSAGANVPQPIRQAILLMVGAYYENREAFMVTGAVPKELPMGVEALLWPYRILAV
jgi:uncharacterized phiE125 gp8 family phage protein